MKVAQLFDDGVRSYAIAMDPGDEAVECLLEFARQNRVEAASFTGLGAFSDVTLGFFDFDTKDYHEIPMEEQVEVVSLVGNFATKDGEVKLHPHVVVARRDGHAFGGHLLRGHVKPTLEVVVEDTPAHLRRETDPATGLPLLKIG